VTDPSGEFDVDSVVISPGNDPPQATIEQPAASLNWAVGDRIDFRGSATDPEDGTLGPSRLSWSLVLQHCTTADNCHAHTVESWDGVAEGSLVAPDHGYPSHLELTLTATDSGGRTDTETVRLDPRTVDLTFRTNPSGLRLAVGATEEATPFTRRVIVASRNSISAPTPQALDATAYRYVSWSDGGARAHDIVAPSTPATYTATYEVDPTPPGLVAAFGFNEGAGSSVADASPEGNAGSVSGAAWDAAGRFGGALSFDGVNDRVTVPDDASLDLTDAMTLEAWVRPTSSSGWRTALLKEHPPAAHAYALFASDGARPRGEIFNSSSYFVAGGSGPLATNAWTHLAATLSGGGLRLYVNGNLANTSAAPGTLPNTGGPLRIGGNAMWGEYFAGLIDEVRVYNRALSAAEIQTDMNAAIAP
jgi:hypothetical protein